MRDRWRALRVAWLVVLLAGAAWLLARHGDEVRAVLAEAEPAWLVLALACSAGQLALNAGFWTDALARLDEAVPYRVVLAAGARSVLGRHVPGGIWYQVGRAALLHREGASRRALATVALLDTLLGPVVALALGVGLLLAGGRLPGGLAWLGLWAVALLGLCSPPVVNRVLPELARARRWAAARRGSASGAAPPADDDGVVPVAARLDWASLAVLGGRTALFLGLSTLTFLLYLRAFPALAPDLPSTVVVAGSYLLASVAGFVAVFAPQGAGVFETALAGLLTGAPLGRVALVAAGFRLLLLLRDVAAAAVAPALQRRAVPAPPPV